MVTASNLQRTVSDIIQSAGGPRAISNASEGQVTIDAVYKWPKIGIPDRHWPVVMPLARASAHEMLTANVLARAPSLEAERAAS